MDSENKDDPIIIVDVIPNNNNRLADDRDKGALRLVRVKIISVRTPRYDLGITISRAEGESHTHIVITYFPNPVSP